MHAKLFCKTGQLAGASYDIKEEAFIGKGNENTIQLFPGLISTKHARIYFDKKLNCYVLEDLKSRNGTRLDGMRIKEQERLSNLHVITFADQFDFIFQLVAENEPVKTVTEKPKAEKAPAPTVVENDMVAPVQLKEEKKIVDPMNIREDKDIKKTVIDDGFGPIPSVAGTKPVQEMKPTPPPSADKTVFDDNFSPPPVLSAKGKQSADRDMPGKTAQPAASSSVALFVLELENVKSGQKSFMLKEGENVVGRAGTCDIPIEDGSMSRAHARITVKSGKIMIRDLESKNHTYIGDTRVTNEVEVIPVATLTFGGVKATLRRYN